MVCVYLKGIRSGLEIMVPGFHSFYDGQHLFVMNGIILFRGGHGVQHVCDGSEFAIITFDVNPSPNGGLRCIGLKAEFVVLVGYCSTGTVVKGAFKASNEAFSLSPKLNTTSLQVKSTMGQLITA